MKIEQAPSSIYPRHAWYVTDPDNTGHMGRRVVIQKAPDGLRTAWHYCVIRQDKRWGHHYMFGDWLDAVTIAMKMLEARHNPYPCNEMHLT